MTRTRPRPREYPAGHFSRVALEWLGPLGWVPQGDLTSTQHLSDASTKAREEARVTGAGWGSGTLSALPKRGEQYQGRGAR